MDTKNGKTQQGRIDWKSTYLPLYLPEVVSRVFIVSPWAEDADIDDFLKHQRPSLLITHDGDAEFQARIEAILGRRIHEHSLVHQEGIIKVYLLDARRE